VRQRELAAIRIERALGEATVKGIPGLVGINCQRAVTPRFFYLLENRSPLGGS
jgi:hypothetical protein